MCSFTLHRANGKRGGHIRDISPLTAGPCSRSLHTMPLVPSDQPLDPLTPNGFCPCFTLQILRDRGFRGDKSLLSLCWDIIYVPIPRAKLEITSSPLCYFVAFSPYWSKTWKVTLPCALVFRSNLELLTNRNPRLVLLGN